MRPAYPAAGDRQRPDQDPPARTKQGPAITPAGPGPPGDLGLDDRPLRDRRPDQSSRRSSRHRPRQDLVHQDPAPRPPYRYRYGGLSPLRTQDSGHSALVLVSSGPGFDLVAQGEVGARVERVCGGEVLTQLGDRGGGAPGW